MTNTKHEIPMDYLVQGQCKMANLDCFLTLKVEGQVGEWVISGHGMTTTVDGVEQNRYDLIDAYIEDGKIGAF